MLRLVGSCISYPATQIWNRQQAIVVTVKHSADRMFRNLWRDRCGGVFVEYLLLLTIVGIGTIAGLATVRAALIAELIDLANSIAAIN